MRVRPVPILKYAKVVVLAPAVGSALIGIAGLLFCAVLIFVRGQAGHPSPDPVSQDPASIRHLLQGVPAHSPAIAALGVPATAGKNKPGVAAQRSNAGELFRIQDQGTGSTSRKQADARLNFTSSIGDGQLTFLSEYRGRAINDPEAKKKVKSLVDHPQRGSKEGVIFVGRHARRIRLGSDLLRTLQWRAVAHGHDFFQATGPENSENEPAATGIYRGPEPVGRKGGRTFDYDPLFYRRVRR
jgi:hypothetical protein